MTHFTEDEILKVPASGVTRGSKVNSAKELFYPKQKRKEKAIMNAKEPINDWPDLINGYLQPIIYQLKRGKEIKVNSHEHKLIKELLEKANEKS